MHLPTPPSDAEKLAYASPNGKVIGTVGLIALAVFCLTAFEFCQRYPAFYAYALFCFCYFANIFFSAFGAWLTVPFSYTDHSKERDRYLSYQPSVDIFLPNCGEPIELLANQFKAVKAIDYPDYKVWVLDDKGSEEVKILADLHGFEYLSRPNKGHLKKAGNLRYAFAQTEGKLILVFDADFVPRSDYLKETVFLFEKNTKLAILQTPQYFQHHINTTPIQRGAGYFQEIFYRLIQNFRNVWGASICCGSNALFRRSALAPFGGAAEVERSEDVNTGWNVLGAGWEIRYLPLNLASGLSPETIRAFFNQHYRWCSGSTSLLTTTRFWLQPNISILKKISYFSSIVYYTTSGLGVFCFFLPSLLSVWVTPSHVAASNYSLALPAVILVALVQATWSQSKWGVSVLTTGIATGYTHLIGLSDVILGDIAPWIPTGASSGSSASRFDRFVLIVSIVPPLLLAILLLGCYVRQVGWRGEIVPLSWISLQVVLSWLVLAEIRQELKCDRAS